MSNYEKMFLRSVKDPKGFWAEAAEAIRWHKKWDTVLDESEPPFFRWYKGGELNTCYISQSVSGLLFHERRRVY